jgi:hypothetical protein
MSQLSGRSEFSILCDIPWDGGEGMAPGFESAGFGGRAYDFQQRQVFVRPRVRLHRGGAAYVLNHSGGEGASGAAIHIVRLGRVETRIALPPTGATDGVRTIIDFSPGNGHVFVLQTLNRPGGRVNQLMALDTAGALQWVIEGPHLPRGEPDGKSMDGSFQKVVPWGNSSLLLIPAGSACRFGNVDCGSGEFRAPLLTQPLQQLQTFATGGFDLVRTVFLERQKRYGVAIYESGGASERVIVGSEGAYGALQSAFGVDDELNIYAHPGQVQNRMSPAGEIDFADRLLDLAYVPAVAQIRALRAAEGGLHLSVWSDDGACREVDLEVEGPPAPNLPYRLVPSQQREEIHIHGGQRRKDPGTVVVFSLAGKRIGTYPYVPEGTAPLGALARFMDWQVAGDGALVIPLTSPAGFQLIRWDWEG